MKKLTRNAIIGASSLSVCDAFSQSKKSSFAFRVAYSDDDESSSTTPEDVKESPCQYYNSIEQRISWALRRQRCNTERGCKFIGRSISGTCLPSTDTQNADIDGSQQATANENITSTTTQISANNTQTQQRNDTNQNPIDTRSPTNNLSATKHRMYAEIVNDDQEFRIPPLRVLVHETLSSSAVDSIRDSQELANELAKCLVIEVLDRKENRGKLGELLQYMFVSDTVLSPTRELIYWSLTLDNTIKNTIFYTNLHRNYWMGLSNVGQHVRTTRGMTREQGAKDFTQDALVALAIKWLHDPVNRKSVINPLLDWTLKSQESVISPLAIISAEAIPWAKEATVEGIIYTISESLKSEEVRKAAADALVSYFKAGAVNKDEVIPSPTAVPATVSTTTVASTATVTASPTATATVSTVASTVVSKDAAIKTTTKPKYVI